MGCLTSPLRNGGGYLGESDTSSGLSGDVDWTTSVMLRSLLGFIFLSTAIEAQAFYPLEQTLTRADVPAPQTEDFTSFGTAVALSGDWLAVSEDSWTEEPPAGADVAEVHLFHRETGRGKKGRPWTWKQSISASANFIPFLTGGNPAIPIALHGDMLVIPGPVGAGIIVYQRDGAGVWTEKQRIADIDGDSLSPLRKLVVSDGLMAVSTVSGKIHTLAFEAAGGTWAPDFSIPAGELKSNSDFALDDGQLAIVRPGENASEVTVEVMERTGEGTWASAGSIEHIELGFEPSLTPLGVQLAFDRGDLVTLSAGGDELGNPQPSLLSSYRSGDAGWTLNRELEISGSSNSPTRLVVQNGIVCPHGYSIDFLGNPTGGSGMILDRNFRSHGLLKKHGVSSVTFDGARIAAADTAFDFLGNSKGKSVYIHRNPFAKRFLKKK